MDIEKIINEVIGKLKVEPALIKEFLANPVETLEKKLGVDLPDEQVKSVVDGIKAKLNPEELAKMAGGALDQVKEIADQAQKSGILDKIKALFGGK